jgi:YrbI family 3-deoxy-D-manno-octulosonate 8-phosphate phosphatase
MVTGQEILAIIPARGGSKGIPGKNIKDFAGFPLIAYSIIAGLRSELVTRVIVSTDDEKIAEVARQWGAEVPFMRPEQIAQDDTLDLPVAKHCLDWLATHQDYQPDALVWLRPTSPIRPLDCVDDAIRLLMEHPEADSVRGVVPAGQNPFKMWMIDEGTQAMLPLLGVDGIAEPFNAPRQVLPAVYWQTGHIDALWTKTVTEKKSMTGDVILPLMIEPRFTVDIDISSEWKNAELMLQRDALYADMVDPANQRRGLPEDIKLIVLDFDGVMTDNRVWVDEHGQEMVAANRTDSLGLETLRNRTGIDVLVLSRETNKVVKARCDKLGLLVLQAVLDKAQAIQDVITERELSPSQVVFMGNDTNDLPVFPYVGFAAAPADAHPEVIRRADLVVSMLGGKGAVRELCDMILSRLSHAAD